MTAKRNYSTKKYSQKKNYRPRSRRRSRSKTNTVDVVQIIRDHEKQAAKINKQPANDVIIENDFTDFDLPDSLQLALKNKGFERPTVIQDQVIPEILNNHDVVGIANTGTGKTLAFVLPIAALIISNGRNEKGKRNRALIICPTRELAQQVEAEVSTLTNDLIHSLVCVGGLPISRQIHKLKQRPEFVIGTPGRLRDLIDRNKLDLSEFNYAVLDEADQMLDMGFVNDMRYILDKFKTNHQTLLFSATFSDDIKKLVSSFTKNAKTISVKRHDITLDVDQSVVKVQDSEKKLSVLDSILSKEEARKVIVFCRTKRGADKLSKNLREKGNNAESIHGDKPQRTRSKILNRFRSHSIKVLVATDVAARGLDVDDITHVINYDPPQTKNDYIHRIGRTGRGGKTGVAITFV